jgi:hypothetical protein
MDLSKPNLQILHAKENYDRLFAKNCLKKFTNFFFKIVMFFYVPASYIMYLSDFCRFLLCTCEWERRGERRAGEGEGARERGIECILYRYS